MTDFNSDMPSSDGKAVATFPDVKRRRHLPLLVGLAASLLIMGVVVVSGLLLYLKASKEQEESQRRTLAHTAAAAAALVDVDLHRTFHSPAQETTAAYLGAIARLERLRVSNPALKFVYTCVKRDSGVFFVLDPTPAGDQDGDGMDDKSHVQQPYPDAGPACLKALETGRAAVDEEPYSDAWGTFISAYAPFFDADGRPAGVVGVDMEVGRYHDELKGMRRAAGFGFLMALILSLAAGAGVALAMRYRLARDLERQRGMERLSEEKARAEEATRAKSDFLATMSHEIRTPLNAIMGMLDLLLEYPLDAVQAERARTARTSAEHLLALLNDILDFSKMEAGRVELEAIPFDAVTACREVMDLLRGQAVEKALFLTFHPAPGMRTRVIGDPARFRQVLINLVGNALKFTERGGVDVAMAWKSADATGGLLEVRVSDTGIGIPGDKLSLLFRKFSQADASTTRQYGGTGLGLAICKRLSEAMGGSVGVESHPGRGSVFTYSLRLLWDEPAAAPAPETGEPGFKAPDLPVLLVEDHPINRKVAQQTLELLGCRVDIAVNGREAVDKAARGDYAAVLMDCRMPEMDGFKAAEAIRAAGGPRGRVPIIAITANAEEEERRRCVAAGMDDFVPKPMRRQDLADVLKRWTRPAPPAPVYPAGAAVAASPVADPAAAATSVVRSAPPASRNGVSRDILTGVAEIFGHADPLFLAELLRLFLDAAPATLATATGALDQGDAARAARAAHALRGAAAQVGAARLAELCGDLERAAAAGSATGEILPEVKREFSRVERELKILVAGTVPPGRN